VADLPCCPNSKEGRCDRSALRLLGEDDKVFRFYCSTCSLMWMVSKPRHQKEARWINQAKRVREASQRERELAARPKSVFVPRSYEA
jgi:hypothetical protein